MIAETVFKIRDEVAFRKLSDGSLTIVSPVTDKMISLNSTAAEIWEMIDGKKSVKEIADNFYFSHADDTMIHAIKKDAFEIIETFVSKELLEIINN